MAFFLYLSTPLAIFASPIITASYQTHYREVLPCYHWNSGNPHSCHRTFCRQQGKNRQSVCHPAAYNIASTDSLKTLYNIHDLGTKEQNRPLNPIIYNVAKRAGNTSARLDILRILGNFYLGNDSARRTHSRRGAVYSTIRGAERNRDIPETPD